ncbi:YbfB/YjiJ family MFS transporter [Mycetohabitans sp. B46]
MRTWRRRVAPIRRSCRRRSPASGNGSRRGCKHAAGIGLSNASPTVAGFALGSLLVGLPFTAITLFAMREARRLHGERAAALLGYATVVYGIGQITGLLVAAPIAERTGSFSAALGFALAALWLGAALLVVVARAAGARER